MTTIFAHLPTGTLYADTCQTITFKDKMLYQQQALKITRVKGEIVALFGRVTTSKLIINLIELGMLGVKMNKNKYAVPRKSSGGIIIIRKGYAIVLRINDKRVLSRELILGQWVALGSGSDTKLFRQAMHKHSKTAKKLLAQVEVVNKVLRYNSLFDKYSNDKVTYAQEGKMVLNSIGWDWQTLEVNHEGLE